MRTPFIIMLALVFGAHYYVLHRLWNMIPSPALRVVVPLLGAAAFVSFFAGFLLRDVLPLSVASFIHRVGTSWLIIFLYLLLAFLALDLLRLLPFVPVKKILTANWISFGVLVSLLTLVCTYGYINYRHKKRTELSLDIAKQAGHLQSLKIVALSDLHLGDGIGKDEFESWLPLIHAENPDIILIAGDLVDGNVRPLFEQNFAESIRKIHAKYGVYAITGNHEYIGNVSKSAAFLHSAGITLLRDSAVLVDGSFYLIGRDDHSNPARKPLNELAATAAGGDKPVILLDHQPYHLEEAVQNGIDLQISGHTHNGQIWPISLITRSLFENPYGYIKKADTHVYVSSGIGLWGGKFRIGTRSEYVVIHLNFLNGEGN